MKRIVVLCLTVMMVLGMIPAVQAEPTDVSQAFAGKTLSILGDSISTYKNYSNGTAAQTTNSTITNNFVYYPQSGFDVTATDTWWSQFAEKLGMEVLVNNSWSGSCIYTTQADTAGAYLDRCVQLHDNTGDNAGQEPDIIAVYLGTNDYYSVSATLGKLASSRTDELMTQTESGFTYKTPANSIEAHAIMLHKIRQRYPDAEVYCFTLIPHHSITAEPKMLQFNADIKALAEKYGAFVVDLADCGIYTGSTYYKLMGDTLHPNAYGMDALTNAFLSSVYANSRYMPENMPVYSVSYDLNGVYSVRGTPKTACGDLSVELASFYSDRALGVSVSMGGQDITNTCYANGKISIAQMTGDVRISAATIAVPEVDPAPEHVPANYRWEYNSTANGLVSVGDTSNSLELKRGSISNGIMSGVSYKLEKSLILKWNQPWVIEWRSTGNWNNTGGGGLLFSERENSTQDGRYFYRRSNTTIMGLGVHTGGNYLNYCAELSNTGIDAAAEHTYRLVNKISATGANMVYLYVDGVQIGALDQYHIGATDKNTTDTWVAGKNFVFSYFGAVNHTLDDCRIDYIQVWESGEPVARVGENHYASFEAAAEKADGQRIQLLADVQTNLVYDGDLYVDLNGHVLSGISLNGTLYGMDSATDAFVCSGGKVKPVRGQVASVYESAEGIYVAVEEDGYSFHRLQAQITTVSLNPAQAALGYRAVFAADEVLSQYITGFGYKMGLADYAPVSRLKTQGFISGPDGNLVTLRLKNIFVDNNNAQNSTFGVAEVCASAVVTLQLPQGTVTVRSPQQRHSMKQTVERINQGLREGTMQLSEAQKTAVWNMCGTYVGAMLDWDLSHVLTELVTYETYLEMTGAQKSSYTQSFGKSRYFLNWRDAAKAVYDAENGSTEVGGGGSVEIG